MKRLLFFAAILCCGCYSTLPTPPVARSYRDEIAGAEDIRARIASIRRDKEEEVGRLREAYREQCGINRDAPETAAALDDLSKAIIGYDKRIAEQEGFLAEQLELANAARPRSAP